MMTKVFKRINNRLFTTIRSSTNEAIIKVSIFLLQKSFLSVFFHRFSARKMHDISLFFNYEYIGLNLIRLIIVFLTFYKVPPQIKKLTELSDTHFEKHLVRVWGENMCVFQFSSIRSLGSKSHLQRSFLQLIT